MAEKQYRLQNKVSGAVNYVNQDGYDLLARRQQLPYYNITDHVAEVPDALNPGVEFFPEEARLVKEKPANLQETPAPVSKEKKAAKKVISS